jgi:type I restriction enzyme S subunit
MSLIDSNEPWLGKVCAAWKRSRIKNLSTLSPGFSLGNPRVEELCTVVPMESVSASGSIDTHFKLPIEEVSPGLPLFEKGDVLFAKITPCMENGKGAFVDTLPTRYAFGSTEFHVIRPLQGTDGRFLYYYTFNPRFRQFAAENMVGAAGQKRVSSRFIKETLFFQPRLPEQQRIAAYLDASCAALDAAMAAKRRQIETLDALRTSMIVHAVTRGLNDSASRRDSGVDWLGEIPAHWSCEHLKRFATRIQSGVTPPTDTPEYYEDGTVPWFAPGSYDGELDLHEPRKLINELALRDGVLRMFPAQTVFVIGIGATIGRVGIIAEPASCNQQIMGIVCNHQLLGRYLAYQLKIYETVIPGIAVATTLAIFNQVQIGYLPVLAPPVTEQKAICDHLDQKLADMKQLVSTIESQIETLLAYRKSLIHECVTGQRRVTEAEVKKVLKG